MLRQDAHACKGEPLLAFVDHARYENRGNFGQALFGLENRRIEIQDA